MAGRPNKLEGRVEDLLETFNGEWLTIERIHHELAGRFHPYHIDAIKRVLRARPDIERRTLVTVIHRQADVYGRITDPTMSKQTEYRIAFRSYLENGET